MASGATVKIDVDVTQFKQGMQQAQQSAKTLNAQMKANESQFKATGDREKYLTEKGKLLKQQLDAQKTAAANAEKALEAMRKNGVEKSSAEYQKMEQALAGAQAAMYDTQAAMNSLASSESKVSTTTGQMVESLNSINKKVSLDTVIRGIDGITGAMKKAGEVAVNVGRQIWDNIMDSAEYADSIATLADRTGQTIEKIQQMEHVAERFEAPAETVAKTWKKVRMSMTSDSEEITEAFNALHVSVRETVDTGFGKATGKLRNYEDVFWDIGTALMRMSDESERERKAQTLLGRSWDELSPLFRKGRKAYEEALAAAPTASEEAVQAAADLNDRVKELEKSWETLKLEAIEKLAPVLETAAAALSGFLDSITEYLKTEPGQKAMESLASAVEKVFTGLTDLDPDKVIEKFSGLVSGLTGTFEWITENWGGVQAAIDAIAIAFGGLQIAKGVLTFMQLLSAGKTISNAREISNILRSGEPAGTGTGVGNVDTENVTNEYVTNANITTGNMTTAHVTTMYVQNMVGGTNVTPGTNPVIVNDGSGGRYALPYTSPSALESGGTVPLLPGAKSVAGKSYALKPSDYKIDGGNGSSAAPNVSIDADTIMFDSGVGNSVAVGWFLGEYERISQKSRYINPTTGVASSLPEEGFVEYNVTKRITDKLAPIALDIAEWMVDKKEDVEEGAELAGKFLEAVGTNIQNGMVSMAASIAQGVAALYNSLSSGGGSSGGSSGGGGHGVGSGTPMLELDITRQMRNRFGFANGLFSVPWDGYPAVLHRGERVLTAREARTYNANSNLYVENMNMNNGMDAAALAAAMNAQNQRIRAGFGS